MQQVQRIQEESGAQNREAIISIEPIRLINRRSAQKAGLTASIQRRTQLRDAATSLLANGERSAEGGTLRRRRHKIADIAPAAARSTRKRMGRVEGVAGKMNRIHEQFMSGGMRQFKRTNRNQRRRRAHLRQHQMRRRRQQHLHRRLSVRTSCSTSK